MKKVLCMAALLALALPFAALAQTSAPLAPSLQDIQVVSTSSAPAVQEIDWATITGTQSLASTTALEAAFSLSIRPRPPIGVCSATCTPCPCTAQQGFCVIQCNP